MQLPPSPDVRGFLPDDEGRALLALAREGARHGPLLEIGSYCGRSTLWLAQAAREAKTVVFAVDHHSGSEEHQVGEWFHDPDLVNENGHFDTLSSFRQNLREAGAEPYVIPLLARSDLVAQHWHQPLGFLFIDGGHSLDAALSDWRGFAGQLVAGGILAIHDVYDDPASGGQAPMTIWRMAMASGLFEPVATTGSLRGLRRLGGPR